MKRRDFLKQSLHMGVGAYALSQGLSEATASEQDLTINYYNQWEPISFALGSEQAQGILINVLNAVLNDRMGLTINHQGLPWKRAQKGVRRGSADALCVVPSEARKEYLLFGKTPVLEIENVIFYNKQKLQADEFNDIISFEDLHRFHVGEIVANDWAKEKLKNHPRVTLVPKLDGLMKILARGRVDIVMAPDLIGGFLAKKTDKHTNIGYVRKAFLGKKMKMFLGIRKTHHMAEEILEGFDREMKDFRETSEYKRLISLNFAD